MGIAPRVAGLEKFPGGIGNRIEMLMSVTLKLTVKCCEFPTGNIRNQQLGQLALKGVRLEDRHKEMQQTKTGRPMQIDFGIAGRVEARNRSQPPLNCGGLEAAGLGDVAISTVPLLDLLEAVTWLMLWM